MVHRVPFQVCRGRGLEARARMTVRRREDAIYWIACTRKETSGHVRGSAEKPSRARSRAAEAASMMYMEA
jgi:hypothetical protein